MFRQRGDGQGQTSNIGHQCSVSKHSDLAIIKYVPLNDMCSGCVEVRVALHHCCRAMSRSHVCVHVDISRVKDVDISDI